MFRTTQQLGYYTLLRRLGSGNFGEVWLAESNDDSVLRVAIKLPRNEQVEWKTITQKIGLWVICGKHPNILPFIEARIFGGQIAIISEYAPDGSLEDMLRKQGSLSWQQAVEMTIGILNGLTHLHSSGIIHRDLKPANILLQGNTPRLADFGISRVMTGNSLSQTVAGTPAYMSPEAFDGKRNTQTDMWSVSVILYRMLTGALPFPQKDSTALIGAIVLSEPEPLQDSLPRQLRDIVTIGLNKNPLERFQNTDEMSKTLQDFLDDIFHQETNTIYDTDAEPFRCGFVNYYLSNKESESEDSFLVSESTPLSESKVTIWRPSLIPYRKGDKWGFCNQDKHIVIEPKYEVAYKFSEGLSLVIADNKRGYINEFGHLMIPCIYDRASDFREGFALVKLDSKVGYIEKRGNHITPLKYDHGHLFNNDLARVRVNGKVGVIDKLGQEIVSTKYDEIGDFSEGLAWVKLNDKCGFIDRKGDVIIPLKYDSLLTPEEFSDGLVCIALEKKWGFIDRLGFEVIPFKYDWATKFSERLAAVGLNTRYGFINKSGDEIIPMIYGESDLHCSHHMFLSKGFNEGLAKVLREDRYYDDPDNPDDFIPESYYGFIDSSGNEVITFIYDGASDFNEGLAQVYRLEFSSSGSKRKYGFIDRNGKEIISLKYDVAIDFSEGMAPIKVENKWGFVDKNGKEIIPPKYDSVESFSNGLALVELTGIRFYIDKDGIEYFG